MTPSLSKGYVMCKDGIYTRSLAVISDTKSTAACRSDYVLDQSQQVANYSSFPAE